MAILDASKIDFLWKRILFGVSKTDDADNKAGSNETIPSLPPILPTQIWADAGDIPETPPSSDTSEVEVLTGADRAAPTADPTSTPNKTWLTGQTDFIPPTFGTGYAAKVYIGDPDGGPAARIFPGTTDEEWVFDYAAGVLHFPNDIPADKTATVGSGTVSVASDGIFIEAYRYIGTRGVGSGGGSGDYGTMADQDADDVAITGGTLDSVTLTNVTIDGGTF